MAVVVAASAPLSGLALAQPYQFNVNPVTSSMSANLGASADFSGTLIGDYNAVTNPAGTRTVNVFTRPAPPANVSKTISGTGSASGAATGKPAGAFRLNVGPGASSVTLTGLQANVVGGVTPPTFPVTATVTYQSFNTAAPDYTYLFLVPLQVPLGTASLTAMNIAQTAPVTVPLVASGGTSYTFSMMVPADVTPVIDFGGSPSSATTNRLVPATGSITISGPAATASLTLDLNQSETIEDDQPAPPNQPFDLTAPPGGTAGPAHLLLSLTITRQTTSITNGSATMPASGSRADICSADFNGDGDTGTDLDIEAFFAALGGNQCPTCGSADFNGDGDTGTDLDIESFFSVLGGGPC